MNVATRTRVRPVALTNCWGIDGSGLLSSNLFADSLWLIIADVLPGLVKLLEYFRTVTRLGTRMMNLSDSLFSYGIWCIREKKQVLLFSLGIFLESRNFGMGVEWELARDVLRYTLFRCCFYLRLLSNSN